MLEIKLLPGPQLWFQCYPMENPANVTDSAHQFLRKNVHIDPLVTLADIFGLFKENPLLCEYFSLSFADELVQEALKGFLKPKRRPVREELEYLEIFSDWHFDTFNNTYTSINNFQMDGIGFELKKNEPLFGKKKGERIAFSLSFSNVRNLLNLPIRIRSTVDVFESDIDSNLFHEKIRSHTVNSYPLGTIIDVIFSTLTFHGGPQETQKLRKKMCEMSKSIDDHCVTTDVEDFFDTMDRDGMRLMFQSLGEYPSREITRSMRKIPDDENACSHLENKFPGIIVASDFREMNARTFRQTFRVAKRDTRKQFFEKNAKKS